MPLELVSPGYPPGSVCRLHVSCKSVGERRYAARSSDEFLGLGIARIDGMWTRKTPCDETFPGRPDREAALLCLLVLHRAPQEDSEPVNFRSGGVFSLAPLRGGSRYEKFTHSQLSTPARYPNHWWGKLQQANEIRPRFRSASDTTQTESPSV